jgi:hypothetical protein
MCRIGTGSRGMYFILKSAFCLTVAFLMLPERDAGRMKDEVRAVSQDRFVRAAVERSALAAQQIATEAPGLCLANSGECIEATKQIVRGALSRW